MAVLLSLETSSLVCSVAVHNNDNVLASVEVHIGQSHASKLGPLIQYAISLAGITVNELSAVAISSGPGSYTGLRIGTSTAKGLCYALNIPLIAINTLEVLAYQMSKVAEQDALLCPMIDARRMEVYCMVVDNQLNKISPVEAKVITQDSFVRLLDEHKIIFFGDGAAKCKSVIIHPNTLFVVDVNPDVVQLGHMALRKLKSNQNEDLINFEPLYLKEFIAKTSVK